tara:strand:- start:447 stop:992 length:546 start_codon:yes stop_codon:yes gene_type:complete
MLGLTKLPKSVVLVGMMGVGKTSVGRKLAKRLSVEFKDSDQEVEKAAGCSVADIYNWYGESAFRDTEKRVMTRLLSEEPHVISTGVETFKDDETRQLILDKGFSVWLFATLETLYPRVAGRSHRPQLETGDKMETLQRYINDYYPIYEKADFRIDCDNRIPDTTSDLIVQEIARRFWDTTE